MKNILIIGGTGFIGSNLTRRLAKERENNVYVLIRPNSKNGKKRLEGIKNIYYIESIVDDLFKNKNLPCFDICYNLAAYGVNYEEQDIQKMIDVNIKLLMKLIDFVYLNHTRLLVHTGTCFEYGVVNDNKKISENSSLNPKGLYGASKATSTIIGNIYAQKKKINMITVRPFGVFGPGEGMHKLVPQIIGAALNNKPLAMTYGEQIRDYLYIDDVVEAYVQLANSKIIKNYDIYNICSGIPIQIKDFVEIVSNITKCNKDIYKLGSIPYRDNEIMFFVGDNNKIILDTDWRIKTDIQNGLKFTIEWYKNNII